MWLKFNADDREVVGVPWTLSETVYDAVDCIWNNTR